MIIAFDIQLLGASKGIGRQIAYSTNKRFNENTLFVLISRDLSNLEYVKNDMLKEKSPNIALSNKIITLSHDFSRNVDVNQCLDILKSLFKNEDFSFVTELYVFYNHGSLRIGTIEKVADYSLNEFQINVASIWVLIAAIRHLFPLDLVPSQFHINISSLWASKLQESCSIYNCTRASRAMMFSCLALEQPCLRVLNYQPGPVYTEVRYFYIFISDKLKPCYRLIMPAEADITLINKNKLQANLKLG